MSEPMFDVTQFNRKVEAPERFPKGVFKGLEKRPNAHTEAVRAYVVEEVLPDVLAWFEEDHDEEETDEIRSQLGEVIQEHRNGYEMAKALDEEFGWGPDSGLVKILEGLSWWPVISDACAAWIRDNEITPKLAQGQLVKYQEWRRKEVHQGEIVKIDPEGYYRVFVAGLGHVREGVGIHASMKTWERLEELQEIL